MATEQTELANFAGSILRLVRRHGDLSQREQFALAVAFIVRTPTIHKILNEPSILSSDQRLLAKWTNAVLPHAQRLKKSLEEAPTGSVIRPELLSEMALLVDQLSADDLRSAKRPTAGRPTGLSQPPRGAKGIVWSIAGEWWRCFSKLPGSGEKSTAFEVAAKTIEHLGFKSTPAQIKGALAAWRTYKPHPGYVAPMKARDVIGVDKIPD